MNEEELAELAVLPNSLVVLEQSYANIISELGHPEFCNINGGICM